MKKIVDILSQHNIVLKSLDEVEMSLLKSKKKLQIFSGITQKDYYIAIFFITLKSRFVQKNADSICELEKKLELLKNHTYRYKYLLISSPMCSKANSFLKESGWKIMKAEDDSM